MACRLNVFKLSRSPAGGINGTSRSRRRIITLVSIDMSDRYRDGLRSGIRVLREHVICGSMLHAVVGLLVTFLQLSTDPKSQMP